MTLSAPIFYSIWGTAILGYLGLGYQYRQKRNDYLDELASDIRRYNVLNDYGQSVGRYELAKDFYNPRKTSSLKQFADKNGISTSEYKSAFTDEKGGTSGLYYAFRFHLFGLLVAFLGIVYIFGFSFVGKGVYLLILWLMLGVSVVLFFVY